MMALLLIVILILTIYGLVRTSDQPDPTEAITETGRLLYAYMGRTI